MCAELALQNNILRVFVPSTSKQNEAMVKDAAEMNSQFLKRSLQKELAVGKRLQEVLPVARQ